MNRRIKKKQYNIIFNELEKTAHRRYIRRKTRNKSNVHTQPNDAIAYAQLLTHTLTAVFRSRQRDQRDRDRELRGCLYIPDLVLHGHVLHTHIDKSTHSLTHPYTEICTRTTTIR